MKKALLLLLFILMLVSVSCKSRKHATSTSKNHSTEKLSAKKSKIASRVIANAKGYLGVKYRYGGLNKRGIDCSGLIYNSFEKENISLPRTTRDLVKRGKKIDLKKVAPGDLVFFKTSKNKKLISHVGLVTSTKHNTVKFIHSSTSKGVMISSLSENYWKKAYALTRRIL